MLQSVRSSVLFLTVVLASQAALLAHPGHEHAADRTLAEQVAHPAFGWEAYLLAVVAAVTMVAWSAWRRGPNAQ